jgi:hypothetical protein
VGTRSGSRKDPPILHTIPTSNEDTSMPHPFCTNLAAPRMPHGCICNQSAPLLCKHFDACIRARYRMRSRSQEPTSSWVQKGSTSSIDVSLPFASQKGAIPMAYMHGGKLHPRMTATGHNLTRPRPRRPQASRNSLVVIRSRTCVSTLLTLQTTFVEAASFEVFERLRYSQHWDGITRH